MKTNVDRHFNTYGSHKAAGYGFSALYYNCSWTINKGIPLNLDAASSVTVTVTKVKSVIIGGAVMSGVTAIRDQWEKKGHCCRDTPAVQVVDRVGSKWAGQ